MLNGEEGSVDDGVMIVDRTNDIVVEAPMAVDEINVMVQELGGRVKRTKDIEGEVGNVVIVQLVILDIDSY